MQLTSRAARNGATINAQLAVRFAVVVLVSTYSGILSNAPKIDFKDNWNLQMLFSPFCLQFLTSSQIVQYQSLWRVGLLLSALLQSQGYSHGIFFTAVCLSQIRICCLQLRHIW